MRSGWIDRHPLLAFYVLAYSTSWSIAVPLALQAQGLTATHLPLWLHYATAFGPALAAAIVARARRAGDAKRHTSIDGKRALVWWTVGFASPLLLFVVARFATMAAGQVPPTWSSLGRVNFLPELGLGAWALWFLTSGIGEEIGWRGYALPQLQRRRSALTSSCLLALAWGGWHLPAFFYLPGYAALGVAMAPGFFVGLLAGAVVLTWLFNSSGGRVLPAVLWHASFNFVTASPDAGTAAAITSVGVIVWAVLILWICSPETLATRRRSVRADGAEGTRALPGDDLIRDPIASFTHAITIACPRRAVWPWLVQMGAGTRGGWYSYDMLDNARRRSAERIVPELQRPAVGTIFPALPGVTDGFTLLSFEPERVLLLGWLKGGVPVVTWVFVLDEAERGAATRLIVRARGGAEYDSHRQHWWQSEHAIGFVHFVMQRKQLLGIARRAEAM